MTTPRKFVCTECGREEVMPEFMADTKGPLCYGQQPDWTDSDFNDMTKGHALAIMEEATHGDQ